jgi:hypothetical protein
VIYAAAVIRRRDVRRSAVHAAPADARTNKYPARSPRRADPARSEPQGARRSGPFGCGRPCRRRLRQRADIGWPPPAPAGRKMSPDRRERSRAAFSCMSNPAEVCRQNSVRSPTWTARGLSQSRTSRVISTSPRPRVETDRVSIGAFNFGCRHRDRATGTLRRF